MAASFVGGAFLGAVFGELLKAVEEVAFKYKEFKLLLRQLKSTLNQITPVIDEIEKQNKVLNRSNVETEMYTEKLKKGKRLVLKCARLRWWNPCDRYLLARRLIEFDKSLLRFCHIDVQLQISRDTRQTLEAVSWIEGKVQRIGTMVVGGGRGVCDGGNGNGFEGCCSVTKVKGYLKISP